MQYNVPTNAIYMNINYGRWTEWEVQLKEQLVRGTRVLRGRRGG